ncbi:ABC transporter ATP-binding protein/permease [Lactiplantibacillus plantarum]|uniref:ABC transporter transmembrane domain-containing protein n=1 Tax=Lactiplantibacillus plantarum TaxID=1590 RepID=UPI0021F79A49|nr:ABC transporter ATP-binding protein [Lactiplantibacillus plantarum]MCW0154663.1 ABC transporter ATP-binding protein/permease [Lactiplantibacillus plantarum]
MYHLMIKKNNFLYPILWLIGLAFFLYSAYLQVNIPILLKTVVNLAVKSHFRHIFINRLVSVFLLIAITSFISQALIGYSSEKVIFNLRNNFFKKILAQDTYQINKPFSEIANRLTNDTETVGKILSSTIPNLLKEFVVLIGSLLVLFKLNSSIFELLILSSLAFTFVISLIGIFLSKYAEQFKQAGSNYLKTILNLLDNWDIIKVLNTENFALRKAKQEARMLYHWSIKGLLLSILSGPIQILFLSLIIIAMIYIIGIQLQKGTMNTGDVAALIMLLSNLLQSLIGTFNNFLDYKQDLGQLKGLTRINHLLDTKKHLNVSHYVSFENNSNNFIQLKSLYLTHNNREILKDISYTFTENYYNITGANGSGKTSLIRAILGLDPITSGSILLPKNMRISYIAQKPNFFIGTLRDNLTLGVKMNDQYLISLLIKVRLWDQVKNRGGLNLLLDSSSPLSGGELQKLAIARSIAIDFDILICDEITSSLDNTSIKNISSLLEELSKTKQVIEITHHISKHDGQVTLKISRGNLIEL